MWRFLRLCRAKGVGKIFFLFVLFSWVEDGACGCVRLCFQVLEYCAVRKRALRVGYTCWYIYWYFGKDI